MELFSPEHVAALVLTALAAAILARRCDERRATTIARALAVAILAGFLVEQAAYVARGTWRASLNLPLNLSDAATLVAVAALWRPTAGLRTELVWFWGFSASLQALVTPDLGYAYPDVFYFTFFVTHSGVVLAACLLVLGMRRIPRPWAVWRVYGLTVAFAVLAGIACLATGGNYMFLRAKPSNGSILDAMGPWPLYLLGAAALALAMLLALEGLARIVAWRDRKRPVATGVGRA